MKRRTQPRSSRDSAALVHAACLALALASPPAVAGASQVSGAVGYERYGGPRGHTAHGGLAVLAIAGRRADAFVQGARYDDSFVGTGVSATAGASAAVAGPIALRGQATSFWGEADYQAWRILAGPQVRLAGGSTWGLSYTRFEDERSFRSAGLVAEGMLPLAPHWTGKASASYVSARWPAGAEQRTENGTQAALGLSWRAHRNLELGGELGLARSRFASAGPVPIAPSGGGLPILGEEGSMPGSTSTADEELAPTALFGLRVLFP